MGNQELNFRDNIEYIAKKTRSTKVVRFFPGSDLRCAHEGLRMIAKENGIDPWTLEPGEFLVFMNLRRTMMKIYAPGNVIAHVKSPNGGRIDLDLVRFIPRFFNGTEFKFDEALEKMMHVKLKKAS